MMNFEELISTKWKDFSKKFSSTNFYSTVYIHVISIIDITFYIVSQVQLDF